MLQGDTRNLPLTGLFQTLEMGQEDGVLTVYFQRMERYFLLRNRTVTLIGERAGSSPNLPMILAGLKILKRQEYENVLSTMSAACAPGDALLQCKLITPEQVFGPVREQILESIYEIFEWRGARYRFEVTKIPPERHLFSDPEILQSMEFPIQSILMEVARREDEWSRIRAAIPHAYQIYRINDRGQLDGFTTPEVPEEDRMRELLRLFDGEHPLTSVLNDSAIPAFHVFTILRTLLERELASAVSLDEKRALAERLRNRRQTSRMAEIYRSILEEDPSDDEMRRRLVFILEKKRENTRELVDHYAALAAGAKLRGDFEGQQVLLRRTIEMAPKDLSIHELALTEFAQHARPRDLAKLVHGYVEQAMKLGQESRASEVLYQLCEQTEEKSAIYEKVGDLFARQGQGPRAAEAYDAAMRTVSDEARNATVRRVGEKMAKFDPRGADKWLKRVGVERKGGRRRTPKLGRVAALLVCMFFAYAGVHEWTAFQERGLVIANAEESLANGAAEEARQEFDEFLKRYPVSFASLDLESIWTKLVEKPRKISRTMQGEVIPEPRVSDEDFDFERWISEAQELRNDGDYDGALAILDRSDDDKLPLNVRRTVSQERRELREYLQSAGELYQRAQSAERSGNMLAAGRIYQELTSDFPHSRAAKQVLLPLVLDVLPPNATLYVDGDPISAPFEVRVSAESLIELRAEAEGFDSFQQILDPRRTLAVTAHLNRHPRWKQPLAGEVDAKPVLIGEFAYIGGRDSAITAWRLRDGVAAWTYEIEGIGDAVGALVPYQKDLIFTSSEGALNRIRRSDGGLVFRLPLPDRALPRGACTEVSRDGHVALVTHRSEMIWVDVRKGEIRWQQSIPFDGAHSPTLVGNQIIVSSGAGEVAAFSPKDGTILWEKSLGIGLATHPGGERGVWVVGTHDHRLIALSASNGEERWALDLGAEPVDRCVTLEGRAAVTTRAGEILVVDLDSGTLSWSSGGHAEFHRSPHLVRNRIITVDRKGQVLVHKLDEGRALFSYRSSSPPGGPIAGDSENFLVIDQEPTLHLVPLRLEGEETSQHEVSPPESEGRFAGR